jgi:ATP-dependent Clp protease ATP-binding subunit ClpB
MRDSRIDVLPNHDIGEDSDISDDEMMEVRFMTKRKP